MKKYLRLYFHLVRMNLTVLLEYRGALFTTFFAVLLWSFFHIIMIILLTYRRNNFFGWNRDEMLLLTGSFSVFWGIFHVLFALNFRRLAELIDRGNLDYVLVKPIDSQFQISFWVTNFMTGFRIFLGIGVIAYVLITNHITPTPMDYLTYILLGLWGTILIYCIWLAVSTILIWQPRLTNIIDLLYFISGMTRYPSEMAGAIGNAAGLFLLPIFLALSTPTEFLLGRPSIIHVITLISSTIFLIFLSRFIWRNALRFYTSSGS